MRVLVTGGAGYIGSHTLIELAAAGHDFCVVDNFSNSSAIALERVGEILGRSVPYHQLDIRDTAALTAVAQDFKPEAVIHFAGLKAVGESRERPVDYYDVNVAGTLSLLRAMEASGCENIVFSSSATVYGEPQFLPYTEDHPLAPTNVYGWTKRIAEQVLTDWTVPEAARTAILLRYFNPVGAHASGRIGEDPKGIPNNLMPFLAQVAAGRRTALAMFGDDYETRDGTGVRDYIHVVDLARAHVAALRRAAKTQGTEVYNIGTGTGQSVREMHAAFSASVGRELPYEIHPRRAGDVAEMQADVRLAQENLGWSAEYTLKDMTDSTWHWQSNNPEGYGAPK